MVVSVYKKAFSKLMEKPIRLWGFSLLVSFMRFLNTVLLGAFFFVFYPVSCILNLGSTRIYLRGYRGQDVDSNHLFEGGRNLPKMIGCLGWKDLWTLIWAFVPIANIVKYYSYKFVPYLTISDNELRATDALKMSMEKTNGYKGQLFLADIFKILIVIALFIVVAIFNLIPVLGILLNVILIILFSILYPLFCGLIDAGMYEAVMEDRDRPVFYNAPGGSFCPYCGRQVPPGYRCACTDAKAEPANAENNGNAPQA